MGNLLKVDDLTSSLVRSRFARVCLEVDLSKLLSRGFWLGDDLHRVFVVVLYERLPTFCYSCGLVGYGSSACPQSMIPEIDRSLPPPCSPQGLEVGSNPVLDPNMIETVTSNSSSGAMNTPMCPESGDSLLDKEFRSWLLAPRRRGRVRGRGASTRGTHAAGDAAAETRTTTTVHRSDSSTAQDIHSGFSGCGRGGHASSHSPRAGKINGDVNSSRDAPLDQNPTIDGSSLMIPRDNDKSNGSSFQDSDIPPLENT